MKKIINLFSNFYDLTNEVKEIVIEHLEKLNYEISYTYNQNAEYNVVLGGDGTFIKAVHDTNFSQIPFIGINTGHLGFYQDIEPNNVRQALNKILKQKDEVFTHKLKVLECRIDTDDNSFFYYSLNEIVLKAKYTSAIHFNLFVNNVLLETFAGDGVIFSTPSGSTAYNLSAGGAIMYQNLNGYQVTPIAAIRSKLHRSLDKSLIVDNNTIIKLVTNRREESYFSLGVDGILQEFEKINNITVKLSEKTINKIVLDKNWFWISIKEKFI